MTIQEIKSKLNAVRTAYREYLLSEEKAEQLRENLSLSAHVISPDTPKQEHSGNATENKYVAAMWYAQQAEKNFRIYMLARQEAEALINSVKFPDEKEVLTRRYILYQKWEEIAEKMHFSCRQIFKIHGKALLSISEKK